MRATAADKVDPSTRIMDVTATPPAGTPIQRNGVRWTELYDASGYPKNCGTAAYTDHCLPGKLLVRNETAEPIVCHGEIRMPPGNKLSLPDASRDMIVMGYTSVVLVKAMTAVNTHAKSHRSDCRPWQPPPPPVSTAGCEYKAKAGYVRLDYPPAAKERQEEGPVVLHFTLAAGSGRPESIEVAGSSLFPDLDAGAVRSLAATDMTTKCPGTRFSITLRYQLAVVNGSASALPPRPPQVSATGEPCKIQFLRPANPDHFYPQENIERQEEGDVIVRVFAAVKAGPPLDAQVATSSGFPALDAAGVQTIMNSRFSANCPGLSQLLKVKFRHKRVAPAPQPAG